jgi:hypothetical protein
MLGLARDCIVPALPCISCYSNKIPKKDQFDPASIISTNQNANGLLLAFSVKRKAHSSLPNPRGDRQSSGVYL